MANTYNPKLLLRLAAVTFLCPLAAFAGDGIVAKSEKGRVIFVNNDAPAAQPQAASAPTAAPRRYVYWSSVEKRWKPPTPRPSRRPLRLIPGLSPQASASRSRRSMPPSRPPPTVIRLT